MFKIIQQLSCVQTCSLGFGMFLKSDNTTSSLLAPYQE